jgi:hypothetical protein
MGDLENLRFSSHVETVETADWPSFQRHISMYSLGDDRYKWCFRGHSDASWLLTPALERFVDRKVADLRDVEQILLRRFKRQAHHFLTTTPDDGDLIEWLALMQHWGVPTRLLDFTLSPYVALFFALRDRPPEWEGKTSDGKVCKFHRSHAVVWAVHHVCFQSLALDELRNAGSKCSPGQLHGAVNQLLKARDEIDAVVPIQPFLLNERLAAQKGLFLCPMSLRIPFEYIISQPREFRLFVENDKVTVARRILIPISQRTSILRELFRMNIGSASLFPGLEGYATSIGESYAALEDEAPAYKKIALDALNDYGWTG